jgi:methylmalonyl-CoA carboxyltransferase large subunit
MQTETVDAAQLTEALDGLRRELARLSERVAALEAAAGKRPEPIAKAQPAPPPDPGLSEELIVVIGAAVAAFLGKKPHIRQIRLLGTTTWAQQGRVSIQAAHHLSVHHARSSP